MLAGIAGLAVLEVVMAPLLAMVAVPRSWKVDISKVPPEVVVSVPLLTVMSAPAVSVKLVLLKVRL